MCIINFEGTIRSLLWRQAKSHVTKKSIKQEEFAGLQPSIASHLQDIRNHVTDETFRQISKDHMKHESI